MQVKLTLNWRKNYNKMNNNSKKTLNRACYLKEKEKIKRKKNSEKNSLDFKDILHLNRGNESVD